jgi:hypothetical protein
MSQMRLLLSATTISPTEGTDALSYIDIESLSTILWAPENPHPIYVDNDPTLPQQKIISGMKFCQSKQKVLLMSSMSHWKKLMSKCKTQTFC